MTGITSVKVRMYRHLLGDCFLLTIKASGQKPSYILIDCGILQNVEGDKERMGAIAANIRDTTDGFIDLLIITHQHHDHISGFAHAKDILLDPDKMKYGAVWMAWTEDPKDSQANALRETFSNRKLAMAGFANALAAQGEENLLNELTRDLQNFIGPIEPATAGLSAAPQGRLTGDRIMEELKKAAPTNFHVPGKVVVTSSALGKPSLPAAILGPPRAESRLFKDLPTKGDGKETYLGEQFLAYSLLGVNGDGEGEAIDRQSPFAPRYSQGLGLSKTTPPNWSKRAENTPQRWAFDHYYADSDDEREQGYRRIDEVWGDAASSLALKLDSDTNNTSLVIAFRLPDKSFLLFAADAQVGNWLSWHDQNYDFGDEVLSAADILGRTRLYKVGHHGSHNATLKSKGLELMNHGDLVAMISTVSKIAEDQGKPPGWQMPFKEIRLELLTRCKGRVLRGDRRWANDPDTAEYRSKQKAFEKALDEKNDLYAELEVYRAPNNRKNPKGGPK